MRKLILLVMLLVSTIALISCEEEGNQDDVEIDPLVAYGPNYKEENTVANKEYLYGLCKLSSR